MSGAHCFTLLSLLLVVVRPMAAQSRSDLAAKYGQPKGDQYEISPGMTLTATYGKDRRACRLVAEGQQSAPLKLSPAAEGTHVGAAFVENFLRDWVPSRVRKGTAARSLWQSGCATFYSEDYENVRIIRLTTECPSRSGAFLSLSVQWKRPACK